MRQAENQVVLCKPACGLCSCDPKSMQWCAQFSAVAGLCITMLTCAAPRCAVSGTYYSSMYAHTLVHAVRASGNEELVLTMFRSVLAKTPGACSSTN